MPKDREPVTQPFTFFLVDGFTASRFALFESKRNTMQAIDAMYWTMAFLDDKAKDGLKKEIEAISDMVDGERSYPSSSEAWKLISAIANKIHEEGYFVTAKWHPPTRESKLMKDLSKRLQE
jgi:hypothetical protein